MVLSSEGVKPKSKVTEGSLTCGPLIGGVGRCELLRVYESSVSSRQNITTHQQKSLATSYCRISWWLKIVIIIKQVLEIWIFKHMLQSHCLPCVCTGQWLAAPLCRNISCLTYCIMSSFCPCVRHEFSHSPLRHFVTLLTKQHLNVTDPLHLKLKHSNYDRLKHSL